MIASIYIFVNIPFCIRDVHIPTTAKLCQSYFPVTQASWAINVEIFFFSLLPFLSFFLSFLSVITWPFVLEVNACPVLPLQKVPFIRSVSLWNPLEQTTLMRQSLSKRVLSAGSPDHISKPLWSRALKEPALDVPVWENFPRSTGCWKRFWALHGKLQVGPCCKMSCLSLAEAGGLEGE